MVLSVLVIMVVVTLRDKVINVVVRQLFKSMEC